MVVLSLAVYSSIYLCILDSKKDPCECLECKCIGNEYVTTSSSPHLHVLAVIDMDVSDQHYWTHAMPTELETHLKNVNFPPSTTYELVLAGPDNIFGHYPISNTRSPDQSFNGHLPCEITDRGLFVERLFSATSTMPPLPSTLYRY